jgi:hypothetical protein
LPLSRSNYFVDCIIPNSCSKMVTIPSIGTRITQWYSALYVQARLRYLRALFTCVIS